MYILHINLVYYINIKEYSTINNNIYGMCDMYENFKIHYESLIYLTHDLIAQSNIINKKREFQNVY